MSSYRGAKSFSFKAEAAIEEFKAVKFGASENEVITAGLGEGFGVAMNKAEIGHFVEVAMIGGGAKGFAGATIAVGDELKSDANGDMIPAVSTDKFIGIALKAATVGQTVSMERAYGYKA